MAFKNSFTEKKINIGRQELFCQEGDRWPQFILAIITWIFSGDLKIVTETREPHESYREMGRACRMHLLIHFRYGCTNFKLL